MKRISLVVLTLIAASVVSGATASTSQANRCARVAVQGTGNWGDAKCKVPAGVKNWIRIKREVTNLGGGIWCAETQEANTGNFTDSACTTSGTGNFIKVNQQNGPIWQVNGTKLNQGSKGISLQNKGSLVLKGELSGLKVTITCETSTGLGTIDGQGTTRQGQGKGTVSYEKCKAVLNEGTCEVVEPIKTNQLKSHLVLATAQEETQIAEVFEPSSSQQVEKPVFVKITLKGCGVLNGPHEVTGSVVAVLQPQEEETQEGGLSFPTTAITSAIHEGQSVTTGLKFGPNAATFSGYYSAKLQNGEPFGAFQE
jgi:hypothetical protein